MSILADSAGDAGVDLAPLRTVELVALHPYDAYLARLSPGSRKTMRGCLDAMAAIIIGRDQHEDGTKVTGRDIPWWRFTYAQSVILRDRLTSRGWQPASVNKHLSAFRQVLQEAWRLGLMTADQRDRARDVKTVQGSRLPAGREVPADERDALLGACDDDTPKGVRDGAVIAILYSTGIRREEAVTLDLADWSPARRQLRIRGKRNKERIVPVAEDALPWLLAWLRLRGPQPGPLFCPVPHGTVRVRRLTGQTIADVIAGRCAKASTQRATPHDFRRTNVGDLLDAGVDLVTASKLAGHSSVAITAPYDRRGQRALLAAVDHLKLRRPAADGGRLPSGDAP